MIECRKILAADAGAIRALYLNLLHGTFTHFPPDAIEVYARDWSVELITQRVSAERHVLLGAFDDQNKAAGFMFGAPIDGGVGTIIWLGVDAPFRNAGIGARLMKEAFDEYKRCGCHKVKVYTETEQAKRFYLKLGMEIEGFHPEHWFKIDFWSLGILL